MTEQNKYKLNLPETSFPMRGNLAKREPEWLKSLEDKQIYDAIRKSRLGMEKYILHDGPPYANGNIHMRHNRPPLKGVFAVKFQKHFGVANLGIRPSIKGETKLQLEVHLLNFSSDLYGQHVSVIFLKKLRDEKKFKSLDELKEQIKLDVIEAKLFFEKNNL